MFVELRCHAVLFTSLNHVDMWGGRGVFRKSRVLVTLTTLILTDLNARFRREKVAFQALSRLVPDTFMQ